MREGKPVTPEGHAAIQRDINSLEKRTDRNLMKFNKEKAKVLHNSMHQYRLGATQVESNFSEKDLGGPGGHQLEHEPAVCPSSKEG